MATAVAYDASLRDTTLAPALETRRGEAVTDSSPDKVLVIDVAAATQNPEERCAEGEGGGGGEGAEGGSAHGSHLGGEEAVSRTEVVFAVRRIELG